MDLVHAPIFVYTSVIFLTKTDANKSTSPRTSNFFFLPMIFDHEVIIEFTQIAIIVQILNQQSIIVHNILV